MEALLKHRRHSSDRLTYCGCMHASVYEYVYILDGYGCNRKPPLISQKKRNQQKDDLLILNAVFRRKEQGLMQAHTQRKFFNFNEIAKAFEKRNGAN